uniref:Uncharacterized protein n=1 Tax=Arundo donax TaxID=35708 RepID=A0A0A8XX94_ARUDO
MDIQSVTKKNGYTVFSVGAAIRECLLQKMCGAIFDTNCRKMCPVIWKHHLQEICAGKSP